MVHDYRQSERHDMGQALRKFTVADYPAAVPESRKKVLAVKGLVKVYKSQHRVLDDINFELHAGEFVAIIGRSGAGKSTLLHVLNGTIPSSAGEIINYHDNGETQNIAALTTKQMRKWRAKCGMIFQDFCLVPRLDVMTNVLLGRLSYTSTLKSFLKFLQTRIALGQSNCCNGLICCHMPCNVQKTSRVGKCSEWLFVVP